VLEVHTARRGREFAAGGKSLRKKDLGLIAMGYRSIYVAACYGAKDEQTLKAFIEAESYPGPSLIIAYSHCIAHASTWTAGCAISNAWRSNRSMAALTATTHVALRRARTRCKWIPRRPSRRCWITLLSENRFKMLTKSKPEDAKKFFASAGHADRAGQLPVPGRARSQVRQWRRHSGQTATTVDQQP